MIKSTVRKAILVETNVNREISTCEQEGWELKQMLIYDDWAYLLFQKEE